MSVKRCRDTLYRAITVPDGGYADAVLGLEFRNGLELIQISTRDRIIRCRRYARSSTEQRLELVRGTTMSDVSSKNPPSPSAILIARVLLLVVVLIVWGAITVGIAFDVAEVTTSYRYLTAILVLFVVDLWRVRTAPLLP